MPLERPGDRGEHSYNEYCVEWINVADNREQWPSLVNTSISIKCGECKRQLVQNASVSVRNRTIALAPVVRADVIRSPSCACAEINIAAGSVSVVLCEESDAQNGHIFLAWLDSAWPWNAADSYIQGQWDLFSRDQACILWRHLYGIRH
jgi:hypothetical protein